ncbi:hypothetical protein [Streptomyces sp. R44]|uniref:Uncharacterized protein n=1 Tax=Streptomyces sp. R44 TaxID=3238633 RepID=A0AB39T1R1_9ACTN
MGFELIQDFERGTVTLAFDDVARFEHESGPFQDRATVVLSRTEYEAHVRPAVVHAGRPRGAAPLNWRTSSGWTPDKVRKAHSIPVFPRSVVLAMLDAADEAHRVRLYDENERGGEARRKAAELREELEAARNDRSRWESLATSRGADVARLTVELSQAKEQRDAWKEAVETLDEKRVRPLGRELAELKAAHEECRAQRRAARGAAPRFMWTSTAEEHTFSDEELQRFAESGALRAPLGSLVAELRAVIVSQAREIARLKGESE